MSKNKQLSAMPLGGVGIIGTNMMVYEYNGEIIIVDAGVSFPDDTTPGVDVIVPDTRYLREHAHNIKGIFITHAHEDHIGAVGYLWDDFGGAPVFTSPFSMLVLKTKLDELGIKPRKGQLVNIQKGEQYQAGSFKVEFVPVSHSIPEAYALAIRTPLGTLIHTGDYKFDDHPPLGHKTDVERLESIGKEGVLAVLGDSTNVMRTEPSGSEAPVFAHLSKLVTNTKGRLFFAAFASHIGRTLQVAEVAAKSGRKVCFLGRTVNKMISHSKQLGYWPASLNNMVVDVSEISGLPADKVFVFASGTQGEGGSSLTRLSQGSDIKGLKLRDGDTVILSSRMIPGNERAILNVINNLSLLNVNVISELTDHGIHVSGHAGRPEIRRMYQLLNPTYVVPVHGEPMHLKAHMDFARQEGYKPLALKAGHKLILAESAGETEPKADFKPGLSQHSYPHGFNYIDGLNILENDPLILRERRKIAYEGLVVAALALKTGNGEWVSDVALTTRGLLDEVLQAEILRGAVQKTTQALETVFPNSRVDDRTRAAEVIQQTLRRHFKHERGKTPTIVVQFVDI